MTDAEIAKLRRAQELDRRLRELEPDPEECIGLETYAGAQQRAWKAQAELRRSWGQG